jgi:hypothetical protein
VNKRKTELTDRIRERQRQFVLDRELETAERENRKTCKKLLLLESEKRKDRE